MYDHARGGVARPRANAARRQSADGREVTLLEILDRVLDKGVVLSGDLTLSVADVDLIFLGLKVMLASVERAEALRGGLEEKYGTVE
ncbi:MAG: gas vesicle protein [Chloroflexi bacterium]|nr:gas vesicle protein [Chloroflexota bacterium]